jgi:hypothetical protein
MNILEIVNEKMELKKGERKAPSIETAKMEKRAKDSFIKAQITPTGNFQFRADETTEPTPKKVIYGWYGKREIWHTPAHTENIFDKLGLNIIENCQNNFTMPLWSNTVNVNDDIATINLQNENDFIYNVPDTRGNYEPRNFLKFTAEKFYVNVSVSNWAIKGSNTSVQEAITADALNQIYDQVFFHSLLPKTSNESNTAALNYVETLGELKAYLYGKSTQHKGTVIMGKTAYGTLLNWKDDDGKRLIKDGLIFGDIPFIVYENRYLTTDGLMYVNTEDIITAQFGGFDASYDDVTDRVRDIVKIRVEGYFCLRTKGYPHPSQPYDVGGVYIRRNTDGTDTTPSSGDTESGETIVDLTSGTTEP